MMLSGLEIVEKPNSLPIDDAEWFIRLTGRNEVAVSARDFKFYSPRHKSRRGPSNSSPDMLGLPSGSHKIGRRLSSHHHMQPLSSSLSFKLFTRTITNPCTKVNTVHYLQNHECGPTSHLPDIAHAHHGGGRLHVMPSNPAKFSDECGTQYLRETSKFCSECGVKRLGI